MILKRAVVEISGSPLAFVKAIKQPDEDVQKLEMRGSLFLS